MMTPGVVWILGNKEIGSMYIREAKVLMGMAVKQRDIAAELHDGDGLSQYRLERMHANGVRIVAQCNHNLQWAVVYAESGGRERKEPGPYCFANRTVALAVVVAVTGVEELPDENLCETEPVCSTCIGPNTYPASYYCTRGIRYDVEVCNGKGVYLLFTNIPSTDFTPHCPGDRVFVLLNLTEEIPPDILAGALAMPSAEEPPFSQVLYNLNLNHVSILPYVADMPLHEVR
jgi:hypothetical protein